MQATVKGTVFGFGPVKHGIAALGIVAAMAAGAVGISSIERGGSNATGTQPAVTSSYSQANHQRFIEQNTWLPVAATQASVNYRFLDANILPGDDVAPQVRTSAQMLFLEQNLLPEAAPVVKSAAEMQLWEQNLLPGDDQPHLAPYSVDGETVY